MWEKEWMLVTSISFYHNVFYPLDVLSHHPSHWEFVDCKCFQFETSSIFVDLIRNRLLNLFGVNILLLSQSFFSMIKTFNLHYSLGSINLPFPKWQILDSSDLKEFADDSFKFDDIDGNFYKRIETTCGKRRNCLLQAISFFLAVFSKDLYLRHVKTTACLGKGWKTTLQTSHFLPVWVKCIELNKTNTNHWHLTLFSWSEPLL